MAAAINSAHQSTKGKHTTVIQTITMTVEILTKTRGVFMKMNAMVIARTIFFVRRMFYNCWAGLPSPSL